MMHLRHYSIHIERAYLDWIKRYDHFHRMKKREDLAGGEAKIEEFLTHLAVKARVHPEVVGGGDWNPRTRLGEAFGVRPPLRRFSFARA